MNNLGQYLSIQSNVDLHFVDQATGHQTTLLFFNGASLALEFWDPLIEQLSSTFRCIRFDQRNAGKTRFTGRFTLNDVASDAAAILSNSNVDRVIAVGHAWGGRAAQVFARDYPHRVRGLVICGTGGQLPPATDSAVLESMRTAFKQRDRATWEAALHDTFCAPGYRTRSPTDFQSIADMLWQSSPSDARWDAGVSPSPSYWGYARVPTLLIYGRHDKNGTPANAQHLHRALADAELTFIEQAGHFVIREAADEVAGQITEFLLRQNEISQEKKER